jgi:preprotein translocase subunit SecD
MGKGKSITLLTIVSVLMAFILVMTFLEFPIGVSKQYNSALGAIELDYDIEGGVQYTLEIAPDNEEEVEDVNEVIDTLKERLEALGHSAYSIKAVKSTEKGVEDYDIRIELKATDDVASDMKVAAAFGEVEFFGGSAENPTTQILEDIKVVENSEYLGMESESSHVISIVFTEEAKEDLVAAIEAEESYYLKITCGETENGEENVLFNSSISASYFDGNTLAISNIPTEDDAVRMALQMKNGGLKYKYNGWDESVSITSPYGEDIAIKCAAAIMTLVLVAIVLFIVLYRGLGLIASLATILFILFETWLLIGVPGIVVNMGGIVGIIASTVLCAACMAMLMQRVKDEYARSEKTAKAAINKGFASALVPTISAHVIPGALALLVLAFAKGVVKCFAITFGIGVAVSLICTLVFTRMFTSLILPLVKDKEKFLRFKREATDAVEPEIEAEV